LKLPPLTQALQQIVDQSFSWQDSGTAVIVTLLILYFGIRGHYTLRVPIWTELRILMLGAVLGFLCDSYTRVVFTAQAWV
jgi:hypothetical protein